MPPQSRTDGARTGALGRTAWALAVAVPDMAMAGAALLTWINPHGLGVWLVKFMVLAVFVEFITQHAVMVAGVTLQEEAGWHLVPAAILIALTYTAFLILASVAAGSAWPVLGFWGFILNRFGLAPLHMRSDPVALARLRYDWSAGSLTWVIALIVVTVIPLPMLGITPDLEWASPESGLATMFTTPHTVVAMAVLYFGVMSIWSIIAAVRPPR